MLNDGKKQRGLTNALASKSRVVGRRGRSQRSRHGHHRRHYAAAWIGRGVQDCEGENIGEAAGRIDGRLSLLDDGRCCKSHIARVVFSMIWTLY